MPNRVLWPISSRSYSAKEPNWRERGIATRSLEALKQAWETEARLREEAARKERKARREELWALKYVNALKWHKGH